MDFDRFMELYFYNLGVHFKEKIDPRLLAKYVMESTEIMVRENSSRSNAINNAEKGEGPKSKRKSRGEKKREGKK